MLFDRAMVIRGTGWVVGIVFVSVTAWGCGSCVDPGTRGEGDAGDTSDMEGGGDVVDARDAADAGLDAPDAEVDARDSALDARDSEVGDADDTGRDADIVDTVQCESDALDVGTIEWDGFAADVQRLVQGGPNCTRSISIGGDADAADTDADTGSDTGDAGDAGLEDPLFSGGDCSAFNLPGITDGENYAVDGNLTIDGQSWELARAALGDYNAGFGDGHVFTMTPKDSCRPRVSVVVPDVQRYGTPLAPETIRMCHRAYCRRLMRPSRLANLTVVVEDEQSCYVPTAASSGTYILKWYDPGTGGRVGAVRAKLQGDDGKLHDVRAEFRIPVGAAGSWHSFYVHLVDVCSPN